MLNMDKESSENLEDFHMKIVQFFAPGALQRFTLHDHHILPHAHPVFAGFDMFPKYWMEKGI